ncbi:MAG: hypothetical protein JWO05_3020 [Gemmatimonadetes bacterium]|nr:hypothetical protein [Gemmatimonadota bacterium]
MPLAPCATSVYPLVVRFRTRLTRFGGILAAVFQLLVPAAASLADVRAEAASLRGATVHIESHGTRDCARVHAADCVLCQLLTGASGPTKAAEQPVVRERAAAPSAASVARRLISTRAPGDPPQRAPPIES